MDDFTKLETNLKLNDNNNDSIKKKFLSGELFHLTLSVFHNPYRPQIYSKQSCSVANILGFVNSIVKMRNNVPIILPSLIFETNETRKT